MQTVFLVTPSPFRGYLLDGCINENDYIIVEKAKDFVVPYETGFGDDLIREWYEPFTENLLPENNCIFVDNINSPEAVNIFESNGYPEKLILSGANFIRPKSYKKLSDNITTMLNIHIGDIRQYRGLDSNLWQALEQPDSYPAVSLHHVSDKIDKGHIETIIVSKQKFKDLTLCDMKRFEIEAARSCLLKALEIGTPTSQTKSHQFEGNYRTAMSSKEKQSVFCNFLNQ